MLGLHLATSLMSKSSLSIFLGVVSSKIGRLFEKQYSLCEVTVRHERERVGQARFVRAGGF